MLKHFKKFLLLVGLLTVGALYADGVEFAYNLTVEGASGKSLVFARDANALDAVDDLDEPWPPNTPGGGAGINYCYFLAGGDDSGVGELLTVLAKDYRSSSSKASTWTLVVETMAGSSFTLNWAAEDAKALASSKGTLALANEAGTTLVANMLTTSSYNITQTGTYYIIFKDKDATGPAPATPAEIECDAVFYGGNVLTFDMDASIENCTVDSVSFLRQKDAETKEVISATTTTVEADVANHKFIVTFGDDVPADAMSLVALYTVSNDNGTAQGRISVASVPTSLNLTAATVAGTAVDLSDNKVTIDFTDDAKTAYQTATFTYSFANSMTGTISSIAVALPNEAANWDYSCTAPGENVNVEAEGSVLTVTGFVAAISPGTLGDAFTLTLTPKADQSPKSGDLTATVVFAPVSGDPESASSTVNLSVKTAGTLDVDGDEEMTLDDVILINAFVTLYPFLGDDITPEDVTEGLSGKDGQACLDALKNLWSSSAIDIDEDGDITLDDVIMINAFVTLYPFLGDDITPEDVTEGLTGKDGDVCLANLKALVP